MRLLDESSPQAEIRDLWSVLYDVLVPASGKADTTQGELLRVEANLLRDYDDHFMDGYYADCREPRPGSLVEQLDFLVDTLVPEMKATILEDRRHASFDDWQSLLERTERLALNYCIAHPLPSFEPLLQRGEAPPKLWNGVRVPGWLGLQLSWTGEAVRVDGLDPRSPALGKLQPGDVIDRIDGWKTSALDGPESAMRLLLKGPSGSTVFLRLGPRLVRVVRGPGG